MSGFANERRKRGRIEVRGNNLRVVVYAGSDPVTGRRSYLREAIEGTTKASYKRADAAMARLIAKVDAQRVTESSVTLRKTLAEWLSVTELEDTTRATYEGYIDRTINPALGNMPIKKITARTLETFNAELRRCRQRCDGRPRIDHKTDKAHDCVKAKCKLHVCKPFAVSTVRQIHAVISGALTAAVRWEWISSNPARTAKRPRQQAPQPTPPSADEAARLLQAAFDISVQWGVLVWLAMTTGMRRGELAALRWENIDLDQGVIEIRSNYVKKAGIEKLKDTKTHQMRRIALDGETVAFLLRLREQQSQNLSLSSEHWISHWCAHEYLC